jgi:hypothetical protein
MEATSILTRGGVETAKITHQQLLRAMDALMDHQAEVDACVPEFDTCKPFSLVSGRRRAYESMTCNCPEDRFAIFV